MKLRQMANLKLLEKEPLYPPNTKYYKNQHSSEVLGAIAWIESEELFLHVISNSVSWSPSLYIFKYSVQ